MVLVNNAARHKNHSVVKKKKKSTISSSGYWGFNVCPVRNANVPYVTLYFLLKKIWSA